MGITANRGLPYPESTDPIAAGAASIQDLADAVDAQLPSVPGGANSSDAGTIASADAWSTGLAGAVSLDTASCEVPGTGRVLVIFSATLWLSAGTGLGSVGVRLSGTAHVLTDPAAANTARIATGTTRITACKAFVVAGMVPGTTLDCDMVYKTAALTTEMSVADRRVDVIPLP